mgnify:CR=1 FL=1
MLDNRPCSISEPHWGLGEVGNTYGTDSKHKIRSGSWFEETIRVCSESVRISMWLSNMQIAPRTIAKHIANLSLRTQHGQAFVDDCLLIGWHHWQVQLCSNPPVVCWIGPGGWLPSDSVQRRLRDSQNKRPFGWWAKEYNGKQSLRVMVVGELLDSCYVAITSLPLLHSFVGIHNPHTDTICWHHR